ncbi:Hypothetical protein (Fragment) [Durusdinium trenchii]|uniref:Methyltransferase type 11 domain-containing protein n=1 Tax=Durusdinium trenchii TaxID=1381693 RepID=A0ABP0HP29_9DINO
MGKTPPGPRKRQRALEEFLRQKDMVILRSQADGSYGYEHAWPIVEEQFGSADFVLFLDHRSFVNVNVILQLVEQLPQQKVMQGCLLEESLFAHGDKRSYLWRRRAPFFPHGMGFVMSKDVAKFLSEMAKKVPLRQAEMPVDVAVGMWVQLLEDMNFVSHQELFHELPVRFGVLSEQDSLELRRHPTPQTAVAWPMGPRWWETFDPQTCQLLRNHTEPAPRGRKPPVTVAPELNCWEGMGGRPEAWYLACCSLRWPGCWGGPYTAELCCANAPEVTLPDPPLGLETLQKFLQFQPHELQLFLSAVANASRAPVPVGPPGRIPCFAGADCAREAFVRFFLGLWREKLLPLRHPWLVEQEDHLLGVNLMLRQGNAGQQPPGQEHILDRVQMSHFLSTTSRRLQDPSFAWARASPRRCLEWDSGAYSRHFFSELCEVVDVVTYYGDGIAQRRDHGPKGKRDYLIDIHIADQVVPENSTALVVCAQVFEHLRQPFKAMRQIFRLMAPLGVLAFSAPLFSEIHGAPQDFWRFTPSGAKTLAEDAGFEVLEIYAPGSLRELSGYLLGMTRPYWQEEDLLRDSHGGWPLQVYMLARKPPR